MDNSISGASRLKKTNPDKGPKMIEGAHHFDKGYESDGDVFGDDKVFPHDHQRGNEYVRLNREISSRDSKKLTRGKFSKIA
jgi:hypothetical protein